MAIKYTIRVFICVFLIHAFVVQELTGWRLFHRGRQVGGNLGAPRETEGLPVKTHWFTQLLDHFNPTETYTWKQRYFVNEEFYKPFGGPVFLMIGGEGEASSKWMTQGAWIDYAKRFGALCFQVEHRYYGESRPTKDLSTKNLKYLTSQQALADLAAFITAMKAKYNLPSYAKWIVFGGSYPGSLAAWMRLKYPHLVRGAMSASGPLLAKIDFSDYLKVIDESLSTYSDECVSAIKEGSSEIAASLNDPVKRPSTSEKFRLCDPIDDVVVNNTNDIANLFETLSDNFAGVVQYNKDNRISANNKTSALTIDVLCGLMVDKKLGPPVDRLVAVNNLILDAYDQKCLDYKYDNMIKNNRNESWKSEVAEGGRQWMYQTCTEFGFFQTSSYNPQVFGNNFPVKFFIQQCMDVFGPKYDADFIYKAAERTNAFYGGMDIEVTNVVFVHGSIDPWHALGITKTINQGAPAIYIKGTAHCANMYPKSDHDLPELMAARVEIAEHIDSWIRLNRVMTKVK